MLKCLYLKIESEDEFSFPSFTLPDQEYSMASDRVVQHHGGSISPWQGAMEPGVVTKDGEYVTISW